VHDIEDAFRRLGDRLARRGVVADLCIRWHRDGARLRFAPGHQDVDALFKTHGVFSRVPIRALRTLQLFSLVSG
jgi:hypothetical protein